MKTILQRLANILSSAFPPGQPEAGLVAVSGNDERGPQPLSLEIAPDDPLIAYFESAPGAVDIDRVTVVSPALEQLRAAGIRMIVPLISQGELIGLLNLGERMSEQDYSSDDVTLLNNLAAQAAPAARVAQLVSEQQDEAQQRERIDQQLRVARIIQQTLLPKQLPATPGWSIDAYYQSAQAVGGDFYDFIQFEDGRLGIVIGDVSDKGVPAALVMATTRSILRAAALHIESPRLVLQRVNDLLHPDIALNMFVTCLYAVLDPASGELVYANAGHCLPVLRRAGQVSELRATGMPLGLLPGMTYDDQRATLRSGDTLLFYSDGLVEAHDPRNELFSFARLLAEVEQLDENETMIPALLRNLEAFTGAGWEQEDDVTILTLQCKINENKPVSVLPQAASQDNAVSELTQRDWVLLSEFSVPSEPGNERLAMTQAAEVFARMGLTGDQVERLKTAVSESAMNAMEHGNQYRAELPTVIQILRSPGAVMVRITDEGGGRPIREPEMPNLEAKLEGLQSPRGWGLFLIRNMVDEMNISTDDAHHTIELVLYVEGAGNG